MLHHVSNETLFDFSPVRAVTEMIWPHPHLSLFSLRLSSLSSHQKHFPGILNGRQGTSTLAHVAHTWIADVTVRSGEHRLAKVVLIEEEPHGIVGV